jgi:hypothetical protein
VAHGVRAGSGESLNLWAIHNCDGTDTPPEALTAAQDSYNETIAGSQVDCSGGIQPACQEEQTTEVCFTSLEHVNGNGILTLWRGPNRHAGVSIHLPST